MVLLVSNKIYKSMEQLGYPGEREKVTPLGAGQILSRRKQGEGPEWGFPAIFTVGMDQGARQQKKPQDGAIGREFMGCPGQSSGSVPNPSRDLPAKHIFCENQEVVKKRY